MLDSRFDMHDVFDLNPSWGEVPEHKRGSLINCNLKDFASHVKILNYDCIFGNWALCYLGWVEMVKMINRLWAALKPSKKVSG